MSQRSTLTLQPPPTAPLSVDCSRGTTACPAITIAGDAVASTATFSGFADPSLRADPAVANQVWMAYSYLEGKPATGQGGIAVGETPSLAVKSVAGQITWYSVRLSYFLEPVSAYSPRYASSWTMRVAAAAGPTPAALASAPETVLGTASTSAAYNVNVRLTALSPLLSGCAFWNNPAISWQGDHLYVITECIELDGAVVSASRTRMVVFATDAVGAPTSWQWSYAGVLADHAVAVELGGNRLESADISLGRDGSLLFTAALDGGNTGDVGLGCQVLELASLNPPALRRSATGKLVVRAVQTAAADASWHTGACTYDPSSSSGLITVAASTSAAALSAELRSTGLRP